MAIKKIELMINIDDSPINCGKYEQETLKAISDFDKATNSEAANQAVNKLIVLNKNGVLFSSKLTFILNKNHQSRLPTFETLQNIPGFSDINSYLNRHWPRLNNSSVLPFFKRIILNLFLCNNANNLLEIDHKTWKIILDSWRGDNKTFVHLFGADERRRRSILMKIAEAYSALKNDSAYKKNLGRKPKMGNQGSPTFEYVIQNPTPETLLWTQLFVEWLNSQPLKNTKKQKSAFKLFLDWLAKYPPHVFQNPVVFLSEQRRCPSIFDFFGGNKKTRQIGMMLKFTEWIIGELMMDRSEDGVVQLGYSIITANEALLLKQGLPPVRNAESTSTPLPTRWRLKVFKILTDNNFAWPKSIANQYFTWTDPGTGIEERIWVPTLTYIFITMLEIPLRRFQVICLDSGEGDLVLYDPESKKWAENTGELAGYWKRHPEAKADNRGVIRKLGNGYKPIVGFHINTNKTQDKNAPSGELTGYPIPWENEVVIKLFTDLRKWQQKYNPVKAPTSLSDINCETVFKNVPSDRTLKETAERFYLFRSPLSSNGFNPYSPPTYEQCRDFWRLLMTELEEVLNSEGDDVKIIRRCDVTNRTGEPAFNIHGLRVATLTALAENGVPIEVLSKVIAGHSSILMTIYYLKFDAAAISATLKNAAENIKVNEAESYRTWLESKSFDEAAKLIVYADEEAFRSLMKSRFMPVWSNEGYGVCPYAGTRCADGGPVLVKSSHKAYVYDTVPGGCHNCLRCRHFITGTPFLIQLWMKANKLIADSQKLAAVVDEMRLELEALEEKKYWLAKNERKDAITNTMRNRIKQLEATHESNSILLDETLLSLHSTYRYIEGIKSINQADEINQNAPPVSLISNEDIALDFKESTRFEQISHIISASRVFPFLKDENSEMEQERFLDIVLMRENLMPLCMMPLSKKQKRMAADAAAEFLLSKVGAAEIQQVHDGIITLKGLGLNPTWLPMTIEKAVSEIKNLGTSGA